MFKTGRELDTGQTLGWLSGMLDSSTGEVSRPCYPLSHESPRAWLTQARLSPSELLVVFFPFVFFFFFLLFGSEVFKPSPGLLRGLSRQLS